jgi:ribose/xylose/arabinose/galactoside ABC-type transport system permease subunit
MSTLQSISPTSQARPHGLALRRILARYGIYIAFAVLFGILSFSSDSFLSVQNVLNVLRQSSLNGIIAVGMTFVIITGGIDLSVGAIVAVAAVVATSFAHPGGYPIIVPVLIGLAFGALAGFINGFAIAKGSIAPFIVTLGMMTIVRGSALVVSGGRPIINLTDQYKWIGGGYFLGIPAPVCFFLLVVGLGHFLLAYTKFGRHVYAIGGNEQAARVSGVNVHRILIGVYTLAGLCAGFAGVVLSSRVMTGSPVAGLGYELDAIAAVVIGGTSLSGGVGSIPGTIVGALIIGFMSNGLDLLNVSSYYQQIIKGVIIIVAVLVDQKNKQAK